MGSTYLPVVLSILVTLQFVIIALYILKSYSTEIYGTHIHFSEEKENQAPVNQYEAFKKSKPLTKLNLNRPGDDDLPKLMIAIVSGTNFIERRNAIRQSWLKDCTLSKRVICKFFTDGLNVKGQQIQNETMANLLKESQENYQDLIVLDTPSGRNFAVRLLAIMEWVNENTEFDFFLRIDDDHFLCLDRLLNELPYRPRERLYWGHLHCSPGVVRIDEGWVMLTDDLVRTFLKTRPTLLCSRFADQSLAMWIYDLMRKKTIIWYEDRRIFHHPPASTINEFKIRKELCHTYISLHGSYPIEMRVFRLIHEREKQLYGENYDIPPVVDTCPFLRKSFNWKWFDPTYYTEPIPCKHNPIWSEGGEHFLGRSIDIRVKLQKDMENERRWKKMHHKTKTNGTANR